MTTIVSETTTEQRYTHTDSVLPEVTQPQKVAPRDAKELSKLFFERLQVLEEGTHEYQYARNTLIEMNMSLVRYAARRFRSRGEEMEDIVQVGTIGLIKAIDRFELSREVEFTSFAIPYIVGEIKRFFRDTTWAVHVPRRLQELRVDLARATRGARSRLDRDPTVAELAAQLRPVARKRSSRALVASNGYNAASLDAARRRRTRRSSAAPVADFIGDEDPAAGTRRGLPRPRPRCSPSSTSATARLIELRFGAGDDPGRRSATSSASPRCTSPGCSPAPWPSSAPACSPNGDTTARSTRGAVPQQPS